MNKALKILMFNNEFPPLGGGTGTVNLELFNVFKNNTNLKIDLISSSINKKKEILQFSDNIRIIKFPVGKKDIHHASNLELLRYVFKSSFAAFKYYKKEKYDFVFVWSAVPAGFAALLLKTFKKVPYIIRIGGPDIPGFENRYKFVYKIISPLIKLIWKKAELLTVKCNTEKQMIEKINNNLIVKTIYNGVDVTTFIPKEKKIEKSLILICSARLIKRKGQYTLIDAIFNLKKEGIKVFADLVGNGDEKKEYIKYAKEKNLAEEIIFSGYVPRKEMPKKYQEADVFVLPSYNEGMSNALLEAMACGLPVIVTNVGGTEELVDNTNGFIFNAGNINELADILRKLHLNKNTLKQLGQNSIKKIEKFNWNTIAREYLNLFNNIVK